MKDLIVDITGKILRAIGIEFSEINVSQDGDVTRVDIVARDPSKLIGWHGETLNAVQHLVKSMIRTNEKLQKAPFIVMDVDGYRAMQEEKVRGIAEAKADFVRRTGARVTLPPMSPYFRRIVHLHIASAPSMADLTTESIGEGDYRQIVIRLKSAAPSVASGEELSPVIAADAGLENLDV